MDQVFPFHVSARLNARRAEPIICSYQPTAVHAVAAGHETLSSWLLSALGGLTVDRTDQRVPLRATAAVPSLSSPTATHVLGAAHDTPLRMLYAAPAGSGTDGADQLLPFQVKAMFLGTCCVALNPPPTTVHEVAEGHDAP